MSHLREKFFGRGVLILLSFVLLSGCAARAPEPNYYSLGGIGPVDLEAHHMTRLDIALGVGPLTVPDYLKRTQIVTRLDEHRYNFEDSHRWAGLLEQDIASVLTSNLESLLGTSRVATFPWLGYFKPDYRVAVDVVQFDSALDGDAVLIARWSISDAAGQKMLASGTSDLRVALKQPGYVALVEAESELLVQFSKELAGQVRGVFGE